MSLRTAVPASSGPTRPINTTGAQGGGICGDIACPAEHLARLIDQQHRDRRFRRDPLDIAVDEAVEHNIANYSNPRSGKVTDVLGQAHPRPDLAFDRIPLEQVSPPGITVILTRRLPRMRK
jgi:hypothetical protein